MPPWRTLCLVVLALVTGASCSEDGPPAEPAGAGERPPGSSPATDADGAGSAEPSRFMRFVQGPDGARLDAAITTYEDAQGRRVDLIAAVHVGDQAYFDTLDRVFQGYDALLYEMVKDPEVSPVQVGQGGSGVSSFQRAIKDFLDLEFQLDAVDYSAANFVHADLDPGSFLRMQEERGESLLGLMLSAMMTGMSDQEADPRQSMVDQVSMVMALMSRDRAMAFKEMLGRQFGELEKMAAGLSGPNGSVLLHGRNEKAFEVLDEQLAAGRRDLGIFYGAAHLEDMELRLVARGFERRRQTWLPAWDIR